MAYDPVQGSIVVFQKDPTKLVGTVSVVGINFGNTSVITVPQGSITALQGTNPWQINVPTPSMIAYQAAGSILAVSGSFSAGNTSVSAFIESTNTSIFALVKNSSIAALQGTNPWLIGNSSVHVMETYLEKNAVTASVMGIPILFKIDETNSVLSAVSPQSPFPIKGSVATLQGTTPWIVNVPTPSYLAIQPGGSVQAVRTDNASVVAVLSNSSVAVLQGTSPWLITGSVMATGNTSITAFMGGAWAVSVVGGPLNINSILGTYQEKNAVTASVFGIPTLFKIDETNSVLSAVSPQSPLPVRGSVTTLQGTNPWVVNTTTPSYIAIQAGGSILAVNMPSPSVVAYQAAGSIMAVSGSFSSGNTSVQLLGGVAAIGSVAVLQGTNPWVVNVPTPSYISYQAAGSILAVNGISFTATSVTGTMSVLGTVPVTQATIPWVIQSTLGTYTENSISTASVIGIPILYKKDETNSVLSAVSPQHPLPVQGSITTLQGTLPWTIVPTSGSIIATQIANSVMGVRTDSASVVAVLSNSSVAVLQGTSPWLITGSIAAALTSGSSIVGTYAEDVGHATGDKGIFTLMVRNDTMSSITNADLDYSPHIVGPVGETIVANSPITKWVSGGTSIMSGTSVQVLAAPGTSIFTYITGIYVTNEASIASRVTITQGLGAVPASMVTWLIAPPGGGSNNTYINPLRILDNLGVSASISAVASIYVTITGFTAKT